MATTGRSLSRTACNGRTGTVALGVRDERRSTKQNKRASQAAKHVLFLNVADDLEGRKLRQGVRQGIAAGEEDSMRFERKCSLTWSVRSGRILFLFALG